jgi:hypothetical protein
METYGWGLGLVLDLLETTEAPGIYLVAHSMGGLVARTFLQNDAVPDGSTHPAEERFAAVAKLLEREPVLRILQQEWDRARQSVRRLFTYGTSPNGIRVRVGSAILTRLSRCATGPRNVEFRTRRMREYLGGPPEPNSLDGKFDIENTFCLVGTAASDYPVAGGFSRRVVGQPSDGNSEEAFGSLSRFLFGDLRVDGDLLVRTIELPPNWSA